MFLDTHVADWGVWLTSRFFLRHPDCSLITQYWPRPRYAQVNLNEAQIQARQSLPSRTRVRPSPVKVYRPTINGVIWAYAMLTFGAEAVLVARVSAKVGLCAASSGVGPRVWDELSDRLW